MSRRMWTIILVVTIVAGLWQAAEARRKKPGEPDRVTVQHLLLSFKGAEGSRNSDRSKKETHELAESLLERARAGSTEDFDALVKEYTDDRYPGIYVMTNYGTSARGKERDRDAMVPGFGDVAFSLEVGEVGMAHYHAALSPYGYHLIRRLE